MQSFSDSRIYWVKVSQVLLHGWELLKSQSTSEPIDMPMWVLLVCFSESSGQNASRLGSSEAFKAGLKAVRLELLCTVQEFKDKIWFGIGWEKLRVWFSLFIMFYRLFFLFLFWFQVCFCADLCSFGRQVHPGSARPQGTIWLPLLGWTWNIVWSSIWWPGRSPGRLVEVYFLGSFTKGKVFEYLTCLWCFCHRMDIISWKYLYTGSLL